jgi:RNA-directed DNA polymerase
MRRRGIRKRGGAIFRLVRDADDFVVMVNGAREHTEAIREEVAAVLATLGLRLSDAKSSVVHLDEGFDFLGWRIQRLRKRGTG